MVGSSHTHLLNVNGDAANRELISRTLQVAGFRVAEATSGTQALNLIRAKPELVILDVTLPDVSAFEVCRRIRELTVSRGMSTVVALHDLNLAARFADVVCILEDGELRAAGPPAEVLTEEMIRSVYRVLKQRYS